MGGRAPLSVGPVCSDHGDRGVRLSVIGLCNFILTDLQHKGGPNVPISW